MQYGYQDSTTVVPGSQGGKFGLNQKAFITKFEFNENAGAAGAAGEAIDYTVKVGEREYRQRVFPINKVYAAKGGGELTDPSTQEYKDALAKEQALFNASITDVVKVFVPTDVLQASLSIPFTGFKHFAETLERLVKSNPNWDKTPIDVFLEYQWAPTGENTKTFLQLPKNVKHGIFITKYIEGDIIEHKTSTHLRYSYADGTQHPFRRTEWYVGSDFAKQTGDVSAPSASAGNAGANMNGTGTPAGSPTW